MIPAVFAHSVENRPAVAVVGDLYTILASGEETGGAYAVIDALIPPGSGPPPHVHTREDEAFYITEGEITFHAEGQPTTASAGMWVHARRGVAHRFRNESNSPAHMLIFAFPAGIEQYFLEVGVPITDRHAPVPSPSHADIERLLAGAAKYGLQILT